MKTCRFATILLALFMLAGCATIAPTRPGKDDFRLTSRGLNKGDKSFTIRAVHVPGVCEAGPGVNRPMLARIAECGANSVAFDLCGLSPDGAALCPKAVETVVAYAQRCKDQHMAPLVRVLAQLPDNHLARKKAVVTAAKALKGEGRAMYWIDGPDAGALARLFKRTSPNLLVAAPENGDIAVVSEVPKGSAAVRTLAVGDYPHDGRLDAHFVVEHSEDIYARLDQALMTADERKPWTPDNSVLSAEERNEGFIALFDGKTLDGWLPREGGKMSFAAKNGCIEWVPGGSGAIMTHDRYDNFILRLEWKMLKKNGNSGAWLRAPRTARSSWIGFEYQMMGDSEITEPTSTSTGSIYDVVPPLALAVKPEGEWNTVEIVLNGTQYKGYLNGALVQDIDFATHDELRTRLLKGFICLTDHGNWVAFRNLRLKKL